MCTMILALVSAPAEQSDFVGPRRRRAECTNVYFLHGSTNATREGLSGFVLSVS